MKFSFLPIGTGDEEVLNQVAMPILADSVCQSHWTDFLPNTEVCAGYENGGKDFCSVSIDRWLTLCEEMPHGMCKQERLRSAYTPTYSNQSHPFSLLSEI